MKLRLDKITSTPSGLVMGVQVRGPNNSWLRFAILEVPFEELTEALIQDYWRWQDRDERPEELDTPLLFDLG